MYKQTKERLKDNKKINAREKNWKIRTITKGKNIYKKI